MNLIRVATKVSIGSDPSLDPSELIEKLSSKVMQIEVKGFGDFWDAFSELDQYKPLIKSEHLERVHNNGSLTLSQLLAYCKVSKLPDPLSDDHLKWINDDVIEQIRRLVNSGSEFVWVRELANQKLEEDLGEVGQGKKAGTFELASDLVLDAIHDGLSSSDDLLSDSDAVIMN